MERDAQSPVRGDVTLAEARDKQLRDQQRSRVQKKMKQDELDKTRRQEEEAELQKKKDEQRRKAERLVAREHQDQQRRRQQLEPDYLRTSERFLQSLERRAPDPRASSAASHTSSTGPSGRPAEFKGLPRVHGETKHDRAASERVRTTRTPEKAKSCRVNRERKFSWITRDAEADCDWALMELVNSFPGCSRVFLEDILDQCDGDCERAAALLS
ncbi:putative epithelial-stromal interaction protein 1-like [Scophthalmus maximus]|uniref:Putative epithelial-stromal interaction protein 1-like n=1 Tax=Scophthalmus maximus TaxID=52904 RepID=A0A2U9CAI4_SCOMX|nr:putative epithelial-stromal interaction protein 1-like [Scophthalmus maximus]